MVSEAAYLVCLVVLSPDRYEVLSATVPNAMVQTVVTRNVKARTSWVRSAMVQTVIPNAMVQTVVTPNVKARTSWVRNAMVQTVIPNAMVQSAGTPSEKAQTSFRNATVPSVLVQSVGIRNVTVVRRYRVVTVLMVVHSEAHCEAPQSVAAVRSVAEAPRCVAAGARCGELQLWQAAHYAGGVHSSESEPRFAAPIELVQFLHDLASAFHLSLNSQVVRHDLVSIHLHSELPARPALCAPAVLRLQLDLHRALSLHAVSGRAG